MAKGIRRAVVGRCSPKPQADPNSSQVPALLKGTEANRPINRLFALNLTNIKRGLAGSLGIDWEIRRQLLGRTDWEG